MDDFQPEIAKADHLVETSVATKNKCDCCGCHFKADSILLWHPDISSWQGTRIMYCFECCQVASETCRNCVACRYKNAKPPALQDSPGACADGSDKPEDEYLHARTCFLGKAIDRTGRGSITPEVVKTFKKKVQEKRENAIK